MYLFNAKIENPAKLEKMLTGRKHIVDMLVEAQLQQTKGGMPSQHLIIGPRGSGKTHILRLVYERLSKNDKYMRKHEIAYMVEEETGIGSYFDLLQRIFEALKRWSDDPVKTEFLINEVEQLKEIPPREWTNSAEKILRRFLDKKILLILIENFDTVMRGMDWKNKVIEISRLRDFIQQFNQVSIIATNQSLIESLSNDSNPLYGFFDIIHLKRLDLDESLEFIKKVSQAEGNEDMVKFMETPTGKGYLETIHEFTRGNHRLLLVFYDFLKADFRSELSEVFLKSLDELKPYYDSFIRNLSPQQQKIIQYLSLKRNPQKGADIARDCFLDKNTISKLISELQRLGYLHPVNETGRDKYYDISEPLLRMCIEINEDRNGIIKLFTNFLGKVFSSGQLKAKYLSYTYLERFQPEPLKRLYNDEARIYEIVRSDYLKHWTVNEEDIRKLESCCDPEEAGRLIDEISTWKELDQSFIKSLISLGDSGEWEKVIEMARDALVSMPNNNFILGIIGTASAIVGKYGDAIEALGKAIEINPKDADAYFYRGLAKSNMQDYEGAISDYSSAIEIDPKDVKAYFYRGYVKSEMQDYHGAISDYSSAIEIDPKDAEAFFHRGYAKSEIQDYKGAVLDYSSAIEIDLKDAKAYFNRGIAKSNLQDYQGAISDFSLAIEIDPKNTSALIARGVVKSELQDYNGAISDYSSAIEIDPKDAGVWNNLGVSFDRYGQLNKAKEALQKAISFSYDEDENDLFLYFSTYLEVLFALKEIQLAITEVDAFFRVKGRLPKLIGIEDALLRLINNNGETEIKEVLSRLLTLCESEGALDHLVALISNIVFGLLRKNNKIDPMKFEILKQILNELFAGLPDFIYPLRYLDIGIRYFLKKDKKALYEFSQEERKIFERFTRDKSS
ncbi:MAG: tetratricopeptide repeat protein [Bacteroidetes bacterium]|nr:tetratricopeptide repeat protein [Bacteroidota bacterium]